MTQNSSLIYVASPIWNAKIDHEVLEFVENLLLGMGLEAFIPALKDESKLTDIEIWKRDLAKIEESKFVIADVSQPSNGIGYEVCYAMTLKKPVIALLKSKKKSGDVSAMISGSPNVVIIRYRDLKDMKERLRSFKSKMLKLEVEACSRCGMDTIHIEDECYSCASAITS
ncbi:MAG: nucleoside 2-deoxyribosyltransferase [Candidatus Hodarchaeales archaeon]|jgi:nucleoside 2-deoxyribosyltransferase